MSETSHPDKRPWYREWGLWLVLAPLIAVVCVSSVMVSIAVMHADDTVIDNYYKEGRMINQSLEQDVRARRWSIAADMERTGEGVRIALEAGQIAPPPSLSLWLDHPFDENRDIYRVLERGEGGIYRAELPELENHWYVTLTPEQARDSRRDAPWRLRGETDFDRSRQLRLAPPAEDAPSP